MNNNLGLGTLVADKARAESASTALTREQRSRIDDRGEKCFYEKGCILV